MTTPTSLTPSTQPPPASDDWPQNAVPRKWIEKLFSQMSAYWGSRFADAWRGTELLDVQKAWGVQLQKLSGKEWNAGVKALINQKFPPTLPEFFALCKQSRLMEAASEAPLQLTDDTRASAEVVEANLARMHQILAPLRVPKEPTAEWAYKLLIRGTSASGKPLPFEVIRCASDAISSGAGKRVVDDCDDPDLKETYNEIRIGVLIGYLNAGRKPWETV